MYHSVLALAPKPFYSHFLTLALLIFSLQDSPSCCIDYAVDVQPANGEEPFSTPTVWELEAMCKEPDRRFVAPPSPHPDSTTIYMVPRLRSNEDCTSRGWSR